MRDYLNIGPTPPGEACAQVGQHGYEQRAKEECRRYIALLREFFGPEPPSARLALKSFDHDFGTYYEVVCWYDSEDEAAAHYAFRCESEGPATWNGRRKSQSTEVA